MDKILTMIMESYQAFYLGRDSEGWSAFSNIVVEIEKLLANEDVDPNMKSVLMSFIVQFEDVTKLREEQNYTMLADIFYDFYMKLAPQKELN